MRRKSAYILFLAVLGLLVIGIVMLFSTSAYARDSHGDVYFFIKRQAIWIGIGLVGCIFAALVNYQFWQKTWWLWFVVALAALALCYIPHIGMRINGSRRWVGYGPITFQPSEFAKIATIFFLAAWFARCEKPDGNVLSGFIIPLAIISVPAALVLGEVDLGTTALIGTTAFVVMFIAGTNPLLLGGLDSRHGRIHFHRTSVGRAIPRNSYVYSRIERRPWKSEPLDRAGGEYRYAGFQGMRAVFSENAHRNHRHTGSHRTGASGPRRFTAETRIARGPAHTASDGRQPGRQRN